MATSEEREQVRKLIQLFDAASNGHDIWGLPDKYSLTRGDLFTLAAVLEDSEGLAGLKQENERLRGQIHEADALLESTRSMTVGASTYQAADLVVALDKVIQQARQALEGDSDEPHPH